MNARIIGQSYQTIRDLARVDRTLGVHVFEFVTYSKPFFLSCKSIGYFWLDTKTVVLNIKSICTCRPHPWSLGVIRFFIPNTLYRIQYLKSFFFMDNSASIQPCFLSKRIL